MGKAVVLGGSGQIGLAVAEHLAGAGWEVSLISRTAPPIEGPWRHIAADRGELPKVIGSGADLLLDCIAFDETHAAQLLAVQNRIGRLAVISSASVYCDAEGRTLDEAAQCGFPEFPVPIREDQPTVPPGLETYSTRKVAMERYLLDGAKTPAVVLRPCAIHGAHGKHAREWWFVKRLLDGRKRIPLAYGGRSQFQTTSTRAIARALSFALLPHAPQVLNVADADAPTVTEIGLVIMDALGRHAELVGLPDVPYPPTYGDTPWSVERPMVCASVMPNSETYAQAVLPAVHWLVEATKGRDWREVLPQLADYPGNIFDYELEDAALCDRGTRSVAHPSSPPCKGHRRLRNTIDVDATPPPPGILPRVGTGT
jgi:nucleoside-diphosphate-sugar epimerase